MTYIIVYNLTYCLFIQRLVIGCLLSTMASIIGNDAIDVLHENNTTLRNSDKLSSNPFCPAGYFYILPSYKFHKKNERRPNMSSLRDT